VAITKPDTPLGKKQKPDRFRKRSGFLLAIITMPRRNDGIACTSSNPIECLTVHIHLPAMSISIGIFDRFYCFNSRDIVIG